MILLARLVDWTFRLPYTGAPACVCPPARDRHRPGGPVPRPGCPVTPAPVATEMMFYVAGDILCASVVELVYPQFT